MLFFDNGRILWNIDGFGSFWFYGKLGDLIAVGDWNGSGIDSIGVVRPSEGKAYLKKWIPFYPDTGSVVTADIIVDLGGSGVPIAGSLTPVEPGWMVVGEREILVPSTGDGQADGLALHRAAGFLEFQDRTADTPWTIRLEAGGYSTALACRRDEAFPEYIVIVGAGAGKTAIGPCRDQSLHLKNSTLRAVTVNAPLGTQGETLLDQVASQTFGVGIGEGVTTITDSTIGHSIDVRSTSNTTIWNSTIDAGAGSALLAGPGPVLVVDSILRGETAAVEVEPDVVGDVTLIDTLIDGALVGGVITCLNVHQELCPG